MNKKVVPIIVSMFLVCAFAFPLASASTVDGSGPERTVTLYDPYEYVNTTVVVPTVLSNETNTSFAFVVHAEAGTSGASYTFNVSINGTWNGTVDIVAVADSNVTGYVNYTANTFDIVDNANITITGQFTGAGNWTEVDTWYGEVDIVDNQNYMLRVTLVQMIASMLVVVIIVSLVSKVIGSLSETTKGGKKK